MSNKPGVLEQERQRREWWTARDLPDPVAVAAGERATERLTGQQFRSPQRDQLDAYFANNPESRPPWWD